MVNVGHEDTSSIVKICWPILQFMTNLELVYRLKLSMIH